MINTVNEHLINNLYRLRGAYGTRDYKPFNKRHNFLMRVHQRYGRNRVLSHGEVSRCKLNPTLT